MKRLQDDYYIAQEVWMDGEGRSNVGRCSMEISSALRVVKGKMVGIKLAVFHSMVNLMSMSHVSPLTDEEQRFAKEKGAFSIDHECSALSPDEFLVNGAEPVVLRKIEVGVRCLLAAGKCPPTFSDEERATASLWAYWEKKGRRMISAIEDFDAGFLDVAQTAAFGEYRFV